MLAPSPAWPVIGTVVVRVVIAYFLRVDCTAGEAAQLAALCCAVQPVDSRSAELVLIAARPGKATRGTGPVAKHKKKNQLQDRNRPASP